MRPSWRLLQNSLLFNDVITEQPVFTGKVLRLLVDGSQSVTEIAAALDTEKIGPVPLHLPSKPMATLTP